MSEQNKNLNYDGRAAELVDLAKRGEISMKRLELEYDWISTQQTIAEAQRRREERNQKFGAMTRKLLGR